jgi:hypothetical protein
LCVGNTISMALNNNQINSIAEPQQATLSDFS